MGRPEQDADDLLAGATALVNSLGALAGFAGTYVVGALSGTSAGLGLAFLVMSLCLLAAAGLMLFVRKEPVPVRQLRRGLAAGPGAGRPARSFRRA